MSEFDVILKPLLRGPKKAPVPVIECEITGLNMRSHYYNMQKYMGKYFPETKMVEDVDPGAPGGGGFCVKFDFKRSDDMMKFLNTFFTEESGRADRRQYFNDAKTEFLRLSTLISR